MNVMGAWEQGVTGKRVVVTILDDGIEKDHPDLMDNYVRTERERERNATKMSLTIMCREREREKDVYWFIDIPNHYVPINSLNKETFLSILHF